MDGDPQENKGEQAEAARPRIAGNGQDHPAPTLRDIQPSDLEDTERTLALHRQAVAAKWSTASEADRLRVLAAAEHARTVGTSNPAGLFRAIVEGRRWGVLTQADEDRAARRLREHQRPDHPTGREGRMRAAPPNLSPYALPIPTREPSALSGLLARIAGLG